MRAIRQRLLLLQSRTPPPLRTRTRTHAHTDPVSRPLLPPIPSLHTAAGEWAADCASCQQLCGEFNVRAIRQRLLLQSRMPPPLRARTRTHAHTDPYLAPFSLPSLLSTPLRVSGLLTVRVADRYVGEFCTAHSTQHTVHRPQHTAHNSLALSPPLYLSSLSLPPPLSPPPPISPPPPLLFPFPKGRMVDSLSLSLSLSISLTASPL